MKNRSTLLLIHLDLIKKMKKPSYLIVVASSCQMYSGTGTAIFDWINFARGDFEFSILMDTKDFSNFLIAQKFCEENDIPLYASQFLKLPGCIDSGVADINKHLTEYYYDYVECISWANSSTNLNVLNSKRRGQKLVFVPHSQPLWTIPNFHRYYMTLPIFKMTLDSADFIFIDSPAEKLLDVFHNVDLSRIHYVPLGVDTSVYNTGNERKINGQVVCICDCREHRKRIDLLIRAFSLAFKINSNLRLVLGGKGSDKVEIPTEIANAVTCLGYVMQADLVNVYRHSSLFILLSDYEAFGLPIAEALCCGTQVLINKLVVLESLFSGLQGVTFTFNTETKKTAELINLLAFGNVDNQEIAQQAAYVFSLKNTYGNKRSILLR